MYNIPDAKRHIFEVIHGTELLWVSSKCSQSLWGSGGLSLQIDSDTVTASDHVRMLGVTLSSDVNLDKRLFQRLRSKFLLASSTSTSSTATGRRVHVDTCRCFRHVPSGLLQHGTCRLTRVCNRQPTTGTERCSMPRQRHAQVRSCTDAASSCRLPLVRCGRPCPVQLHRCLHKKRRSTCRLLHRSLEHRRSSATTLSTPSPAGRTTLPTQRIRPSGILCRRTRRLEIASRLAQRSTLY